MEFYKYQGTGNDFVMIDNRNGWFPKDDQPLIERLCDRKFGVGADGLILLESSNLYDFTMVYYNSDGRESSMCGNGGRCLVAFADYLNIGNGKMVFDAIDGLHHASIEGDMVSLQMTDVASVEFGEDYVFLDTGSPHHVEFEEHLSVLDVKTKGADIRYGVYGDAGSNINFVKQEDGYFRIRTYERGVEDETLSCGTGATAVAIAMHALKKTVETEIDIKVEGGMLQISFEPADSGYKNVFLKGKAVQVFKGELL